jgi:hypothetical protein
MNELMDDSQYLADKMRDQLGESLIGDNWALGQAMIDLNVRAINVRYGERNKIPVFNYHLAPTTKIQALMSLECWLYQCTEGDVPNDPLYRYFDETIKPALMESIIHTSKEWDGCSWG